MKRRFFLAGLIASPALAAPTGANARPARPAIDATAVEPDGTVLFRVNDHWFAGKYLTQEMFA